jgi:hypothetical protein
MIWSSSTKRAVARMLRANAQHAPKEMKPRIGADDSAAGGYAGASGIPVRPFPRCPPGAQMRGEENKSSHGRLRVTTAYAWNGNIVVEAHE